MRTIYTTTTCTTYTACTYACVVVCVQAGDVVVPLFWAASSVCFLAKHHRYIHGGRECSKRRKQLSRPLCLFTRAVAFRSDFTDRIIGVCSLLFISGVVCTLMLARRIGERVDIERERDKSVERYINGNGLPARQVHMGIKYIRRRR